MALTRARQSASKRRPPPRSGVDTRKNYRGGRRFDSHRGSDREGAHAQAGLFGLAEHLERLGNGDPLEVLEAVADFEHFRGWLIEGLGYGDCSRGGGPPFDPVSMFKALPCRPSKTSRVRGWRS